MHNLTTLVDNKDKYYLEQILGNKFYLELFCSFYQVKLMNIVDNQDSSLNGFFTDSGNNLAAYCFSDIPGGVLADGVVNYLNYHIRDDERKKYK